MSSITTAEETTMAPPPPYHPLWQRQALLLTPALEILAILFVLSPTTGDRIRIVIFMALLIPLTRHFIRPIIEPMLPVDPRAVAPQHAPARMLADKKPGAGYEREYAEVVRNEEYVARPSRRVVMMERGGWFALHE